MYGTEKTLYINSRVFNWAEGSVDRGWTQRARTMNRKEANTTSLNEMDNRRSEANWARRHVITVITCVG